MRLSGIIRLLLVVLCVTALLTLARSGQHLDRSQRGMPLPGMIRPASIALTMKKSASAEPHAAPISKPAAPHLLNEQDSDLRAAVPATTQSTGALPVHRY